MNEHVEEGNRKFAAGDYRGAAADYTAEAYLLRGMPRYLLGDKEGAGRDWRRAGQLGLEEGREMVRRLIAPPEAGNGSRTGGPRRA